MSSFFLRVRFFTDKLNYLPTADNLLVEVVNCCLGGVAALVSVWLIVSVVDSCVRFAEKWLFGHWCRWDVRWARAVCLVEGHPWREFSSIPPHFAQKKYRPKARVKRKNDVCLECDVNPG